MLPYQNVNSMKTVSLSVHTDSLASRTEPGTSQPFNKALFLQVTNQITVTYSLQEVFTERTILRL